MAFHIDQRFDRGSRRAPGCKVGKLAIGNVAPDQQAACPQSMTCFIEFVCIKIGEFEVAPVMQSRPFVPSPADRRCQSDGSSVLTISAAVPANSRFLPQDRNT